MVKRLMSKPRKGGYHMPLRPKEDKKVERIPAVLPVVDPRDQEVFAEREMNHYISRNIYGGRAHQPDYRDE
jgi:hypothetical protein